MTPDTITPKVDARIAGNAAKWHATRERRAARLQWSLLALFLLVALALLSS